MAAKRKRSEQTPSQPLSARIRFAVSCLLILHLVVVVATPWGMVSPGSSLARRILGYAAPYVQAGNISHGYAFFAPDPGPGHIVEYELVFEDGSKRKGAFPDLQEHWPRLRYHRHFMLTEQLAAMLQEPPPPPPEDPRFLAEYEQNRVAWEQQNELFKGRARSYGQHLLEVHGAKRVELHIIRHRLPTTQQFLDGLKLDDRSLYQTGDVVVVSAQQDRQ